VLFFAHVIGEPADGEEIGRAIEGNAVVKRQTFTRENFVGDRSQTLVGVFVFDKLFTL
jgi:hypothetical protein